MAALRDPPRDGEEQKPVSQPQGLLRWESALQTFSSKWSGLGRSLQTGFTMQVPSEPAMAGQTLPALGTALHQEAGHLGHWASHATRSGSRFPVRNDRFGLDSL